VMGINAANQTVTVGDPEGGSEKISFDDFVHSNVNQYFTIVLPES